MKLDAAVADASALLALVGVVPVEPPDVVALYAPDAALTESIAVLRDFHEGRLGDVNGDLALLGPSVRDWVGTSRFAGTLARLVVEHSEELVADLAAVALARTMNLPLVTGIGSMVELDPDVAVVVLPRRR